MGSTSTAAVFAFLALLTTAACSSSDDATGAPGSPDGSSGGEGTSSSGGPSSGGTSSGGTSGATPPTNPQDGPAAGNPDGHAPIPPEAQAEDVSTPTTVVGTGTPASCTGDLVVAAVATGGVITF